MILGLCFGVTLSQRTSLFCYFTQWLCFLYFKQKRSILDGTKNRISSFFHTNILIQKMMHYWIKAFWRFQRATMFSKKMLVRKNQLWKNKKLQFKYIAMQLSYNFYLKMTFFSLYNGVKILEVCTSQYCKTKLNFRFQRVVNLRMTSLLRTNMIVIKNTHRKHISTK